MARWVAWEVEEFRLLIDLIERYGDRPPTRELEDLRLELRRRARTERATEPNFRSIGSIVSQINRLSRLMRGDPRAGAEAPLAMRAALEQHRRPSRRRTRPLVSREELGWARRKKANYKADRQDLAIWLDELRSLLADLVERAEELVDRERAREFGEAWMSIEEDRPIERAIEHLRGPELDEELAAVGLVGAPLRLKLSGFRRSMTRLIRGFTWTRLKPVLKWANVTLGSLANVIPGIDPVKEFKEAWEAAAEEAYEQKG